MVQSNGFVSGCGLEDIEPLSYNICGTHGHKDFCLSSLILSVHFQKEVLIYIRLAHPKTNERSSFHVT